MNPYTSQPAKAFWSPAIAKRNFHDIEGLWTPKFPIAKTRKIATFGSCFAQHIGRAFDKRGYHWLRTELAPTMLSAESAARFNYGVFTARTGNIYTTTLLAQWCAWALDGAPVPEEIWEQDGRFYDPFRPNIEPDGFASAEEVVTSRNAAIKAFGDAVRQADVFVFTMGLTESWWHREGGYEYPMCPGTVAGTFDPERHEFRNQRFATIRKSLRETIRRMREENPKLRFLLTVSPVPLTATATDNHVLVATMESKSILRAVAAETVEGRAFVDYFPSYEIINSPVYRGSFFEPNQRSVNHHGVDHVMRMFFSCLNATFPPQDEAEGHSDQPAKGPAEAAAPAAGQMSAEDLVCEEELLASFGAGKET
jgi:hypothetical protein